jgi:hypothetical protein
VIKLAHPDCKASGVYQAPGLDDAAAKHLDRTPRNFDTTTFAIPTRKNGRLFCIVDVIRMSGHIATDDPVEAASASSSLYRLAIHLRLGHTPCFAAHGVLTAGACFRFGAGQSSHLISRPDQRQCSQVSVSGDRLDAHCLTQRTPAWGLLRTG